VGSPPGRPQPGMGRRWGSPHGGPGTLPTHTVPHPHLSNGWSGRSGEATKGGVWDTRTHCPTCQHSLGGKNVVAAPRPCLPPLIQLVMNLSTPRRLSPDPSQTNTTFFRSHACKMHHACKMVKKTHRLVNSFFKKKPGPKIGESKSTQKKPTKTTRHERTQGPGSDL